MTQLLEDIQRKKIIIYGAGKIGQRVSRALRRSHGEVLFFWDINAEIIGDVDGIAVLKPDFEQIPVGERAQYAVLVTIFSESVSAVVEKRLREAGYSNVVLDRQLLNELIFLDCSHMAASKEAWDIDINVCNFCPKITTKNSSCELFSSCLMETSGRRRDDRNEPPLIIPSMGLLTTTRCTLSCEGCNHLRDHFKPAHNFDIACEDLFADLETLLEQVDMLNKLVVVGGEAFLHPEFSRILDFVLKLPKVGIIHIITNGTVLPDDKTLALLSGKRLIVEVSGYGDRLPSRMQDKVGRFLETLASHGINYHHTRTMQWFDFGGFEDRHYTQEELRQVYAACCFVSNDLFNGKLFACSRSAFGNFLGKFPHYSGDYVDLRGNRTGLRERLIAFFNRDYTDACRHCNGTSVSTIVAGRQATSKQ